VQLAGARPVELTAEAEVNEAVFRQAYIPRKLEEVVHFERDARLLQSGAREGMYFQTITGMAQDGSGAATGLPKVLLDAMRRQELGQVHARSGEEAELEVAGGGAPGEEDGWMEGQEEGTLSSGVDDVGSEMQTGAAVESREWCVLPGVSRAAVSLDVTGAARVGFGSCSSVSEDVSEEEKSDAEGEERGWVQRGTVDKDAQRHARRENKRLVKEEKAKKRESKVPKKVKRKAEKKGKFNK
jgi:RIO kinase 1